MLFNIGNYKGITDKGQMIADIKIRVQMIAETKIRVQMGIQFN